jgi:hypothetical protein
MQWNVAIATFVGREGLDLLDGQNEIRSIDWLSRSPESVIRVARPAPSDQQLAAMQAAASRFLARLAQVGARLLRRPPSRRIHST